MTKQGVSVKQAAEKLGVDVKWVRGQIASGTVSPKRRGNKRNGSFIISDSELGVLRQKAAEAAAFTEPPSIETGPDSPDETSLERISQLEVDRANLLAQVAWTRAIAAEQQKALEREQERSERLTLELEVQRCRVEALKALSTVDRFLGRHKAI